jgi:chaperone modulatory protein CbpM
MNTAQIRLRVTELCERVALPEDELKEIVAYGIIEPRDSHAREWEFEPEMAELAARAARLHRDLQIDWAGVALALDLLEELDALRRENHRLKMRLGRFES